MSPTMEIFGFTQPVSSWTHLLGATVAVIAGIRLIGRALGSRQRVAAVSIFVFGLVFLLSMSGTYHLLSYGTGSRAVLQRLDHAAIWTLIAGTFTAIHVLTFRGFWAWGVVSIVLALGAVAIAFSTIYFDSMPEALTLSLYLSMGWFGVVSIWKVMRKRGFEAAKPILYGGVCYTAGAVVDFAAWLDPIPGVLGPHELFHFTVLAGATYHFVYVWKAVDLHRPRVRTVAATRPPLVARRPAETFRRYAPEPPRPSP